MAALTFFQSLINPRATLDATRLRKPYVSRDLCLCFRKFIEGLFDIFPNILVLRVPDQNQLRPSRFQFVCSTTATNSVSVVSSYDSFQVGYAIYIHLFRFYWTMHTKRRERDLSLFLISCRQRPNPPHCVPKFQRAQGNFFPPHRS